MSVLTAQFSKHLH